MVITGKNLELLEYALELAQAELHNQSATCPNVFLYEEDLEAIEYNQVLVERLLSRVKKARTREALRQVPG